MRSFTVQASDLKNVGGGRYMAKTPLGAAKKAFTQLCRKNNTQTCSNKKFVLKETTKGSKNKEYKYVGSRNKLSKPIKVPTNYYLVKYKSVVKSLKKK